jgi:general secretion pathway protein N
MSMRRWQWWALGAAAYVIILLALFPAQVAYRFAPQTQLVQLGGIEGTLWSGRAAIVSVAGLRLRELRWELSPWGLLLGRLRGDLDARLEEGFIDTRFDISPATVRLIDLNAGTALTTLANTEILGYLNGMSGQASLALERLVLRDGWIADVRGQLRVAGLAVPPLLPTLGSAVIALGNYEVQLSSGDADTVLAQFKDAGGPLGVSGTLTLNARREYRLDGRIQARPEAAPELLQGIELMTGEPDATGYRPLLLSGSL